MKSSKKEGTEWLPPCEPLIFSCNNCMMPQKEAKRQIVQILQCCAFSANALGKSWAKFNITHILHLVFVAVCLFYGLSHAGLFTKLTIAGFIILLKVGQVKLRTLAANVSFPCSSSPSLLQSCQQSFVKFDSAIVVM